MTGSADDSSRNENLRNWIVSRRELAHKNNGKNSTEWLVQPEIQLYSMRWWTFNSLGMNFSTHWTLAPPSNSWLCHNRDLLFSHNKNFFFGWMLWGILNECCVFFTSVLLITSLRSRKKRRRPAKNQTFAIIAWSRMRSWKFGNIENCIYFLCSHSLNLILFLFAEASWTHTRQTWNIKIPVISRAHTFYAFWKAGKKKRIRWCDCNAWLFLCCRTNFCSR